MSAVLSYLRPTTRPASQPQDEPSALELLETSKTPNHPNLAFPVGDFRNAPADEINDVKCEVMVNWLHSQQEEKQWVSGEEEEGVILKKSRGEYTCAPAELTKETSGLLESVEMMNVRVSFVDLGRLWNMLMRVQVAMTVTTRVIRILLSANTLPFVEIEPGLRVQVLQDVQDLPQCQKHQFAAFLVNQGYLLVWDDDPKRILQRAEKMEMAIMRMIWGNESAYPEENGEKQESVGGTSVNETDTEGQFPEKPRRIVLLQSWLTAFTLMICLTGIGAGWRDIAVEMAIDFDWKRLCFLLVVIPQFWLSLVSSPIQSMSLQVLTSPVLLPSSCGERCTDHRPCSPNSREYKVLLWHSTSPSLYRRWAFTTRNHSMPSLQGRSPRSHRAHCPLHQGCNIHIRDARWYCKHSNKR